MYDCLYENEVSYRKSDFLIRATLTIDRRVTGRGREDAIDAFLDYMADTYPELEAEVEFVIPDDEDEDDDGWN